VLVACCLTARVQKRRSTQTRLCIQCDISSSMSLLEFSGRRWTMLAPATKFARPVFQGECRPFSANQTSNTATIVQTHRRFRLLLASHLPIRNMTSFSDTHRPRAVLELGACTSPVLWGEGLLHEHTRALTNASQSSGSSPEHEASGGSRRIPGYCMGVTGSVSVVKLAPIPCYAGAEITVDAASTGALLAPLTGRRADRG
jgi:hypothetical protein